MRILSREFSPRARLIVALCACLLCTPALFAGLVLDDHWLAFMILNPPSSYGPAFVIPSGAHRGEPGPRRVYSLAAGIYPLEVRREDEQTLIVRAQHGLLQPLGTYRGPDAERVGAVSPVYLLQRLNQFGRAQRPFVVGETSELEQLHVEVLALSEHGLPSEVRFRFRMPLEHPSMRFVAFDGENRAVPFTLPAPGERIRLPVVLE